jgi:hypothetical protein
MDPAAQLAQHLSRLIGRSGLAEYIAIDNDNGISTHHPGFRMEGGGHPRFFFRESQDMIPRCFPFHELLVDVARHYLEA